MMEGTEGGELSAEELDAMMKEFEDLAAEMEAKFGTQE